MKPGTRLKSAVDDTEVMVIKNSGGTIISCGGAPMSDTKAAAPGTLDPAFSGGTQVGKRYVDEAGTIELLCVKAGKGSLAVDGTALAIKDAKPLPSSD
jgi:hypothetical protein